MEDIKKKTEKGIKWSAVDQVFRLVLNIAISAFLARFITPAEYGLFAMVTLVTGFLSIFKDFGLGNAVIYKTDITTEEINNIFWVNNGIAGLLGVVLFIGAPFIADFYAEPKLILISQAMAILFTLGSLSSIPDALVRKNIDFKKLFTRNITNLLLSGVVAIVCASLGFGLWSLIIQMYISTIVGTYLNFKMVSWRPSFKKPQWQVLKPFLSYSLPLFGENSFNYWVRNVDNLLVGKILGEQTLGFYNRAYNLMLLPVKQISGAIMRVVFPAFSLIKHDKNKVWVNYKKLLSTTSFVTFPLMAAMFVLGDEIIMIVYGKNWMESVPIFKGLCFLGAIQSIGTFCGSIFSSQGKTLLQFKMGLFTKTIMISGIVGGLYLGGISGLIIGYTITSCICFIIESFFVMLVLEQKFLLFFTAFIKELLITLFVFGIVYILKAKISLDGLFLNILLVTILGGLFYISLSFLLKTQGILFIKEKINGTKKDR